MSSQNLLQKLDPILHYSFSFHDFLVGYIVKHIRGIKFFLLGIAYASFLGIFFPELRREFGSWSRDILLVLLFLSPLSKIFRMRLLLQLMGFRREMGILMGYWATVHVVGFFFIPNGLSLEPNSLVLDREILFNPPIFIGIMAYILTLPLLATANTFSQKLLKMNWKRLHTLVYGVFILALLHGFASFRTGAVGFGAVIETALVFGLYVFCKILARNNFLPFLRDAIQYVSQKYASYQNERAKKTQSVSC